MGLGRTPRLTGSVPALRRIFRQSLSLDQRSLTRPAVSSNRGPMLEFHRSDSNPLKRSNYPRPVVAAGISPEHRAVYLDTATIPRWLVKSLARSEKAPLPAYVWRIDLPTFEPGLPDYHPAIDATYAFLLRGAVTATTDALLSACRAEVPRKRKDIEHQRAALPDYLVPADRIHFCEQMFDSAEERMFYEAFLREATEANIAAALTPQVDFKTLAPGSDLADGRFRVDFVAASASETMLVIEIDGEQHATTRATDDQRDAVLKAAGFPVVRLPASRIRQDAAGAAKEILSGLGRAQWGQTDDTIVRLQQLAQLQIAVVASMRARLTPSVGVVPIRVSFADSATQIDRKLLQCSLQDLAGLLRDMAMARGDAAPNLVLTVQDDPSALNFQFGSSPGRPDGRTVYLHNTLRFAPPLVQLGAADSPSGKSVDRDAARNLFERCFGFSNFRSGQFETVERVIRGLDTLLLLPTGAGKSAVYQFATLVRGGVCIVVDPLLSLIDDQIQNFREHGVDRSVQISSQLEREQQKAFEKLLCQGNVSFVFVSPEQLQKREFRQVIERVAVKRGIALITIDEAHCVSQWGHDFRPAYLNVANTARSCSRLSSGISPPVLAMTGTASYAVLRDIQREVGITDPGAQITPKDFDRPELRFLVISCRSADKGAELAKAVDGMHKRFKVSDSDSFWDAGKESPITGLVFCPHVNGGHGTVEVARVISDTIPTISVSTHSGKPPKGIEKREWDVKKADIAARFKRDEVQVLACTNSFGMGIDKPNIRFTVHWGLPQSIESFYQETGRAGRGGAESWCILLMSDDNPSRADRQLAGHDSTDEPPFNRQSDIDRQLWFHKHSFPDATQELNELCKVIETCMSSAHQVIDVSFGSDDAKPMLERAVYRLLLIGVARDYTVDWRYRCFQVYVGDSSPDSIVDCFTNYVSAFNSKRGRATRAEMENWRARRTVTAKDMALYAGKQLIEFTYSQIEGTRRRALSELRRVAKEHIGNEDGFRHALLAYLNTSAFSSMLQTIVDDPTDGGLDLVSGLIERIESPLDAADLATQAARLLAAIYDHPGLLTIRAIALLASTKQDAKAAAQDLAIAFDSARRFGLEPLMIVKAVGDGVKQLAVPRTILEDVARNLTANEGDSDRASLHARLLAQSKCDSMASYALSYLVKRFLRGTDQLLETLKHAI